MNTIKHARAFTGKEMDPSGYYYYGARGRRDLCFEPELRMLAEALPQFRYVPALSEPADGDDWDGETGLITDVVRRHEPSLSKAHAYVCGPPPMVEAALKTLCTDWEVE